VADVKKRKEKGEFGAGLLPIKTRQVLRIAELNG